MRAKNILVLCTGNSCRSQIAEAYLRYFAKDKAIVYSAGIETHGLNTNAVATMKEDNLDISKHTSNLVDEYKSIEFDLIITVCDNAYERCPYFPGSAKRFHHNFSDPAKTKGTANEVKAEFQKIRDMIKEFCENFVNDEL